ncbi:hypothetical protein ACFLV4_04325 [Chloroflexota bacterium]
MVWIVWESFTREWLKRSRRRGKEFDDGDRFLSLWIAFNGWMRGEFGEALSDRDQLDLLKVHDDWEQVFNTLQLESSSFARDLNKLRGYQVANMRHPNNANLIRQYDGSFESLIEVIYSVRSNLFHGRKDINEGKKDFELVVLSFRILRKLFTTYLKHFHPYILP